MIYDIKWSIAITTFLYFYNTVLKSYKFRKNIDLSLTLKITALSIPGTFLGAYLLLNIQAQVIHLLLALLALLYLVTDYFKLNSPVAVTDKALCGCGFVYGFISGVAGSGSIVKAIVFKHMKLPKEAFVATMAASALPLNVIKIGIFSAGALVGLSDIPLILLLLVSSFLGIQLGKKVLAKISQHFFEKLVRLMLLALSVKLMYSALA